MSPANLIAVSSRVNYDVARRIMVRAYRNTRRLADEAFNKGDIETAKRLDAQADRMAACWAAPERIDGSN